MSKNNKILCDFCSETLDLNQIDNLICLKCGKIHFNMIEDNKSENNITNNKISIYQRKNHFKSWINSIQGKHNEINKIPDTVMEIIKKEIKIQNIKNITKSLLKKILKKKNLNKYYDQINHIMFLLTNKSPPIINKNDEEKLLEYFNLCEIAFEQFKKNNKTRKNLLRYSYILYKLCELLEIDYLLDLFNLLKDRIKSLNQDKIWKFICNYNNWEFYNTA
jgi:hypothetical protein